MNSTDHVPLHKIDALFDMFELTMENYRTTRSILDAGVSQANALTITPVEAKRWKYLDGLQESITSIHLLIDLSMRRKRFRDEIMRKRLADEKFAKLYDKCFEMLKRIDE